MNDRMSKKKNFKQFPNKQGTVRVVVEARINYGKSPADKFVWSKAEWGGGRAAMQRLSSRLKYNGV